jgi:small subunit ribosomal protein S3
VGQKVHPVGLRLGITRTWDSRWFEDKNYRDWLHEDLKIRRELEGLSRSAAVAKVEIERRANQTRVMINTAKPGIIIGKRGAGIDELKKRLEKITGRPISVNVVEIKHPEIDAKLVANNIVDQLEKRIAFRRAMRQALQRTMKAGAKGIKVQCGGRLGGAEIARVERNFEGKVPLHTLRANIDYAQSEAYTTFGRIGVKVWIYLGEVLPDGKQQPLPQRDARPARRGTRTTRPAARPVPAPAAATPSDPVAASPAAVPVQPAEAALTAVEPASAPETVAATPESSPAAAPTEEASPAAAPEAPEPKEGDA